MADLARANAAATSAASCAPAICLTVDAELLGRLLVEPTRPLQVVLLLELRERLLRLEPGHAVDLAIVEAVGLPLLLRPRRRQRNEAPKRLEIRIAKYRSAFYD